MPRVKAIAIPEWEKTIVVGQEYDATQSFIPKFWYIRTDPKHPAALFAKDWFEEVALEAPMSKFPLMLKAISSPAYFSSPRLVIGMFYAGRLELCDSAPPYTPIIYEIEQVDGQHYIYSAAYFVVVPAPVPLGNPPPTLRSGSSKASVLDADEERCWQAMKPRVAPGNCVCDCPRSLCIYHRD